MKAGSFKATLHECLRVLFHRMDCIAACMVLSVGGAAIYAFFLADEEYTATNEIYITEVPGEDSQAEAAGTSLIDPLTLLVHQMKSESAVESLIARFWDVAKQFPGQAHIQEESLAHLTAQLEANPGEKSVARAVEEARENLQQIEERDKQLAGIEAMLEKGPDNREARDKRKAILKRIRQEQWRLEEAVQSFRESMSIQLSHRRLEVSYRSTSPELAKAVTDEIVNQIIERHNQSQSAETSAAEEVYEEQIQYYIEQADAARAALERYAKEYPEEYIIPIELPPDPESIWKDLDVYLTQKNEALDKHEDIKQAIADVQEAMAESSERIGSIADELLNTEETLVLESTDEPPPEANRARDQIAELEQELSELLVKVPEDDPLVKRTRQKIHLIDAYLSKLIGPPETIPNPRWEQMAGELRQEKAELVELRGREEQLREELLSSEETLGEIPARLLELEELRDDYLQKKEALETYRARLDDARVGRQLRQEEMKSSLSVQCGARLRYKPHRPGKSLAMAIGLLVGVLASIVTVSLVEQADHTIRSAESARRHLGVHVLGTIPEFRPVAEAPAAARQVDRRFVWLNIILAAGIVVAAVVGIKGRDFLAVFTAGREASAPEAAEPAPEEKPSSPPPTPVPTVRPDYIILPEAESATGSPAESTAPSPTQYPSVTLLNYIIIEKPPGDTG